MELNRVLASLCRQRILLELSEQKELTMMALVRGVNSTYGEVNRNLQTLQKQELMTQKYVGRLRIIRLNWQNEHVSVLLKALKSLQIKTVCNRDGEGFQDQRTRSAPPKLPTHNPKGTTRTPKRKR
jgi:hypothetical protein